MKLKSKLLILVSIVLLIGLNSCKKDKEVVKYGKVSGTVIDSQTGEGLADATVSLAAGSAKSAGLTAITDADGYYLIENVPVGTYTGTVEADGFFVETITDIEVIEGENPPLDPVTVAEAPPAGSLRIILTWGETPYDLDTHLTGPASDGVNTFHLYFGDMYDSIDINVNLDVDDTYSYGPETTTILHLVNGTYRYSVHNYSNQESTGGSEIASSPAKVKIYDETGLKGSYTAPEFTGAGNTWRVFELHVVGTQITIVPINTYVEADYSNYLDFKSAGKKK